MDDKPLGSDRHSQKAWARHAGPTPATIVYARGEVFEAHDRKRGVNRRLRRREQEAASVEHWKDRALKAEAKLGSTRNKDFYDSEPWRRLRYQALKASQGCCNLCGDLPSPGNPLHVDHIKPRSLFPKLELDPDNLQVLCARCNLGKGARDSTDWRTEPKSAPGT